MKIRKKIILGGLACALSLSLVACGTDNQPEDDHEKEYMVEGQDEPVNKEKAEEINTINRIIRLVNEVVDEKFEDVHFLDSKIVPEVDEPEKVHIADIFLFINEDNKEKAEQLIEEYSKVLIDRFDKEEDYEEVILIWTSPNHNKENAIELEYYE